MVDLSESTLSITVLGFFLDGRLKCVKEQTYLMKKIKGYHGKDIQVEYFKPM